MLIDTSSQVCHTCEATSKEINDINRALRKKVNPNAFKLGLSTLHGCSHFLECIIHHFCSIKIAHIS